MSKLAIFLSDLDGGGAERVMLNLALGFTAENIQVDLVLARVEGAYTSQIPPQVKLVDLQAPSLLISLPSLSNYLKQERPQVLLSALEDTNLVALAAKLLAKVSTQVIVTVHNTLSQESRNATEIKRKIVPYLLPWFYPYADAVVAVSEGVAADLVKLGLRSGNLKVIYNPIVTPDMKKKLQETIEHPWFTAGQPPVILGVGRFTKQKDFPNLLRAFAQVRQQQPARLILLGEGQQRSSLESLAQELGIAADVALPGFVDNPYAYMVRAAVLVLSSAWEGFGNVLVESMAAGTPVVSTNCECGPAEILSNGKYGKLVNIGDDEEMAQAIMQTLKETTDRERLQKRAKDFSLENAVAEYKQLMTL